MFPRHLIQSADTELLLMKTHRVLTGQANLRYRKIPGVFYSCTGLLDAVLQPRILDNRLFLNVDFDSNGFF